MDLKGKRPDEIGKSEHFTYTRAGVDSAREEVALEELLKWIKKTFRLRKEVGVAKLKMGYFANVIDIGRNMGIAISTDGVGTKVLIAQMMGKYDTIGIDCVAMNVNDILCVGAEPISMVDYIAVQEPHPDLLEGIGKGLYRGAQMARITIPAGEIAQLKELIKGKRETYGFDLVGTCVGIVSLDKVIMGQDIQEGDIVLGLESSGIHSNGLTLARQIFFDKMGFDVNEYFDELGRTIGEELLEPTRIYVPEVTEILNSDLNVKALIHITGDGFLNLTRVASEVGYVINYLPEPPPIFSLIKKLGNVTDEEMYKVYNMGIGFCLVMAPDDLAPALEIIKKHDIKGYQIGCVRGRERRIIIEPRKLTSKGNRFYGY
ncbi:MAG: phosphoribosylformylglycinamidine cyclo-ligase [Actinomycetota bacterium]|nr:phosphoribosylformylglycinamidine cyclo-ligase [Actinomycetota bacterium]